MSRALSIHPGPCHGTCTGEHTCEHVQAMERALQAMKRVGQTTFRVRRDLSHIMQTVDSSSLVQVLDSYSAPIPGTDPQDNTEGFDDEQMEMNEVPDYCFVAITQNSCQLFSSLLKFPLIVLKHLPIVRR